MSGPEESEAGASDSNADGSSRQGQEQERVEPVLERVPQPNDQESADEDLTARQPPIQPPVPNASDNLQIPPNLEYLIAVNPSQLVTTIQIGAEVARLEELEDEYRQELELIRMTESLGEELLQKENELRSRAGYLGRLDVLENRRNYEDEAAENLAIRTVQNRVLLLRRARAELYERERIARKTFIWRLRRFKNPTDQSVNTWMETLNDRLNRVANSWERRREPHEQVIRDYERLVATRQRTEEDRRRERASNRAGPSNQEDYDSEDEDEHHVDELPDLLELLSLVVNPVAGGGGMSTNRAEYLNPLGTEGLGADDPDLNESGGTVYQSDEETEEAEEEAEIDHQEGPSNWRPKRPRRDDDEGGSGSSAIVWNAPSTSSQALGRSC